MNNYRHEFKYIITSAQKEELIKRISAIMRNDSNTINGKYNIRSLYFDDYYNSCYYDNENGIDPREKYRIRIYNISSDFIKLECKQKDNNKTRKESCLIDKQDYHNIINGNLSCVYNESPVISKLKYGYYANYLKPVVIVDYDRIPFVYDAGNVRITFDYNLSASSYIEDFFCEKMPRLPIYGNGIELLEVKYDDFLPDFIYNSLQLNDLCQTSNSKYYLARKMNNYI